MAYDFLVCGADGMQGRIVVRDLIQSGYTVLATDIVRTKIGELLRAHKRRIAFQTLDLRDVGATVDAITSSGATTVVNCAEGDWNLNAYRACLDARVHCIDLGSRIDMTEEQLKLDGAFRAIRRMAITGCGSVPGIGNVMLRHAAKKFDSIETIETGFAWDSNIKRFVVPFSIESILEEFVLPAPYIVNRHWRTASPMRAVQTRNFRSIGYQQVFLADHPETFTFFHYYRSKGLKNVRFFAGFPAHSAEKIRTLLELGFANKKPVRLGDHEVVAAQFLGQFFKRLRAPRGYQEWENLWVDIVGRKNRKRKHILMECLVPTLPGWGDAGCNIDTGMPASIMAQMLHRKAIKRYGSFAPEAVIPETPFFTELRARRITVYENGEAIN